jgi:hypothetical protein
MPGPLPQPEIPQDFSLLGQSAFQLAKDKLTEGVNAEVSGFQEISNQIKNATAIGAQPKTLLGPDGKMLTTVSRATVASQGPLTDSTLQVHRYPAELGNDENPHYVMFFINIPQSRLDQAGGDSAARAYYDPTSLNRINTANIDVLPIAGQALGASLALVSVAKAGGAAVAGDFAGAGAKLLQGSIVGTAGLAAGNAAGGTADKLLNRQPHVLLKECIALHIQSKPSTEYSANWSDQDLGSIGSIAQAGRTGFMSFMAREAILKAAMLPKLVGLGFDFRSFVEKAESRVNNPHKEQLFRSMGMRKFSFEYIFAPKSALEYNQVQRIIRSFKTYMHPVVDPSKYYLVYPAEFNIIHYYKDNENEHLHKITSCALTDMKVEFGGQDFLTFQDMEGAPTEIFMNLTFVEMEMLTAERIKQGF